MTMYKNFQFVQFIVSVFPIHFKGRDINDGATIISSVFQENANQLECEIINLHTYL